MTFESRYRKFLVSLRKSVVSPTPSKDAFWKIVFLILPKFISSTITEKHFKFLSKTSTYLFSYLIYLQKSSLDNLNEIARKTGISDLCFWSLYEILYYPNGWSHDSKISPKNEFLHLVVNENSLEEILKYSVSYTIQMMH